MIIFKQLRIGYQDKPFYIYKIRTMNKNEEVTKIGRFLRQTGLDELPQIWNILKGDLVLVGPRPLTPQDHNKYRGFPLSIKPGITGWWQINGRFQKEIAFLDMQYLEIKCLLLDIYIILKTIPLVLLRRHG